jgi:hypothetical protein
MENRIPRKLKKQAKKKVLKTFKGYNPKWIRIGIIKRGKKSFYIDYGLVYIRQRGRTK